MKDLYKILFLFMIFIKINLFNQPNNKKQNKNVKKKIVKRALKGIKKKSSTIKPKIKFNNKNKKVSNKNKNKKVSNKINNKINSIYTEDSIDEKRRFNDIEELTKNIPKEFFISELEQLTNQKKEYIVALTFAEKTLKKLEQRLKKEKKESPLYNEILEEIQDYNKLKVEIQNKIKNINQKIKSLQNI